MSLPRFGVNKPVVVNLLMVVLLAGGIMLGADLRREFFPETAPDAALITMPYPGASPEEIETALAIKVEDVLDELDEVREIRTTIAEGVGTVTAEFHEGEDPHRAIQEVRRVIDRLEDLPADAEDIDVELLEEQLPVIRLALYGQTTEGALKHNLRAMRDELRSLRGMGRVTVTGVRDYEIRVDIDQQAMLRHGLDIATLSQQIGQWMQDVPGGMVEGDTSVVTIRTLGVPEQAEHIEQIVIRTRPDAPALRLGDIAQVRQGFMDESVLTRFNGEPAAFLTVYKSGDQDIVSMANMVQAYVAGQRGEAYGLGGPAAWVASGRIAAVGAVLPDGLVRGLEMMLTNDELRAYELGRAGAVPVPPGTQIEAVSNLARFVEDRLALLIRNAVYGAMLVFATLLLVLNWRIASWVGIGLATALFGTVLVMWWLDVTLNLLTTFGLIVVLGLLVDDAIVVAENIQVRHQGGEPPLDAAINGTTQILWPVVATVSTTVAAFLPLTLIAGRIGELIAVLPLVVAVALAMSLVEALLILPSHIGHTLRNRADARSTRFSRAMLRWEGGRDRVIFQRIVPAYAWVLQWCLRRRYLTLCAAVALLLISLGMVAGGKLPFNFMPSEDAETIIVDLRMPLGTPASRTLEAAQVIEQAARAQAEVTSVSTLIGQAAEIETGRNVSMPTHRAQIFIELAEIDVRDRTSGQVIATMREQVSGRLTGVDRLSFDEITGGPTGEDISIRVRGPRIEQLRAAADDLKQQLEAFEGVFDVRDDEQRGQPELQISLKPAGAALGLDQQMIAQQLRGYVFGLEAHTFAAQEEDIDVRVRADELTRRSLHRLENAWIVSPEGTFMPLSEVALVRQTTGYAALNRVDRQRVITVNASIAPGISPEAITPRLDLDQVRRDHPGVELTFAGRQEQMAEAFGSLPYGFLVALAGIYVILAWLFGSYVQPILVMLIIPFAIIGVVWGHVLLGFELTFLSMIGFVALSGIVVNGSLILIHFYNGERAQGLTLEQSMLNAGRARFRPILLTTVTTVLGLTPLMLEQAFQARFLIPMAIAVAFGLLVATLLLLVLLPCMTLIGDDLRRAAYYLWHGEPRPSPPKPHGYLGQGV